MLWQFVDSLSLYAVSAFLLDFSQVNFELKSGDVSVTRLDSARGEYRLFLQSAMALLIILRLCMAIILSLCAL